MSILQIRQATPEDIDAIETMYAHRVAYNNANNMFQWEADEVTWKSFSKLYTMQDYYVGTLNGKVICGLFIVDMDMLYWPNANKGDALYLHKICVDPDYRSLGYANKLINFFIEKGRVGGYSHVCLDVRAHKDKLRAMYERHGFVLHRIISIFPGYQTALYTFSYENRGTYFSQER